MSTFIKKDMCGPTVLGPVFKLDRPGIKKWRFVYRNGGLFFQVKEDGATLGTGVARFGIVNEFDGGLNLIFGRTTKYGYLPGDDPGGLKTKGVAFVGRITKFIEEGVFFRPFTGKLNVLFIFSDQPDIMLANDQF